MLLEIKNVSFEVTIGEGLGGLRRISLKCAHTPNPYTTAVQPLRGFVG